MKNYKTLFLILFISYFGITSLYSQEKEGIKDLDYYQTLYKGKLTIALLENKKYALINVSDPKNIKYILKNIKYVVELAEYQFQIIDENNKILYLDREILNNKLEKLRPFLCGNVSEHHYSILKDNDNFIVKDSKNRELHKIPFNSADKVFFINNSDQFSFDGNFSSGGIVDPETIIIQKDKSFFTIQKPELKYDNIDFSMYKKLLITKKNNLYGIYGKFEPRYKKIYDIQ